MASPTSKRDASKLLLPEWDPLPVKHLHASHDLISLLHLDGLYNTYVRPYFDPVPETDDEAPGGSLKRPRRKQGLSKGYVGLLEDCIDPMPLGTNAQPSLLPLVPEYLRPGEAHPWQPEENAMGPLALLPPEAFASARLEVGVKVDGYAQGVKLGVKEAEERRARKKARMSQSVAPDLPDMPGTPVPGVPNPPPPKARTPFSVPRKPVQKPPFPRASAPPGQSGFRPGTPGTPTPRPAGRAPGTPSGTKRPGDGPYPTAKKRAVGTGSRSASPMGASSSSGNDVSVRGVFKR
ncbi:hypothetical protein CcaverHIS002_0704710 [Cutaneotrichosporon cavernicola]|uniref:Uncharacterized protein n=1 Tax=Cutaneotrichosporon cavernicola TaxID=279322 RepID=A0AA48LAC5_9TREE|nr:uncharacterized protein CcaverHIS019_0704790 [Cutaneotrichosporon cavernicola]BEI87125.1 hypothetical protein CcaverHIS002_0704710 [Cutaneotrichosporon cavernicola]BEI94898.1 hypothetical protein CcaverHIS019_0704790 [Cutaneotrichosporon cavernicola]